MLWGENGDMKKSSFLGHEKALLTCMVQAETPDRIKELMSRSSSEGAEAFGIQFCRLKAEYRNAETYNELFKYIDGKPVYVTNYRNHGSNSGKSDDALAVELVELAECGATLCDVIGDMFDKQDDEVAKDNTAIEKQMKLIDELHKRGAEVLMSSHIFKFTPAERVLEIALEHQRRGADISKIVTGASNRAEEIENLGIMNLLRENLKIPILFLSVGECYISRRIGATLGNCMSLCVYEYDELSTKLQPLLRDQKLLRDTIGL